jgi:predicted MFS family arabinose efflux permease
MTLTQTAVAPEAPFAPSAQVSAAVRATYIAFIGAGFAFASWASRIPQVRDQLQLSAADLGLVLLAIAVGSIVALPLAGAIVQRITSRRTVAVMSVTLAAGLATVAVGYLAGIVPIVVGLLVLGFANGAWDVAMNVQGATVERRLGRTIMPRFHAGFSVGTVAGALVGAGMVALGVSVTAHLAVIAVVIAILIPLVVRSFLNDTHEESVSETTPEAGPKASVFARWREPRTLLIGLCVLAFAFAEGVGNDWISVALIDGHHSSAVLGTLAFAAFLAAMTVSRWFGTELLDRYGRVNVIRGMSVIAIVGVLLFVFSPSLPLAFAGALLWGAGAALGFPVGMSAAADDPVAAPQRVSVVASIGYCAFLAGPPLIGFLGENLSVLKAVVAVAVLIGLATLITGQLREPATKN